MPPYPRPRSAAPSATRAIGCSGRTRDETPAQNRGRVLERAADEAREGALVRERVWAESSEARTRRTRAVGDEVWDVPTQTEASSSAGAPARARGPVAHRAAGRRWLGRGRDAVLGGIDGLAKGRFWVDGLPASRSNGAAVLVPAALTAGGATRETQTRSDALSFIVCARISEPSACICGVAQNDQGQPRCLRERSMLVSQRARCRAKLRTWRAMA